MSRVGVFIPSHIRTCYICFWAEGIGGTFCLHEVFSDGISQARVLLAFAFAKFYISQFKFANFKRVCMRYSFGIMKNKMKEEDEHDKVGEMIGVEHKWQHYL